jgi:hypothetical protein
MNDDGYAFERATRALLEDGSDRTPAATIDAVLLAVRTTPQERDLRIPWRTAPMPIPMRLVAAIAVIVVAGAAAFSLFKPSSGAGGLSTPSPTVTPSAPAPSPSPQPTPFAIDLTTWTSYTSTRYGFSISHPADWTVTPATRAWVFPADATVYGPRNAGTENFVAANGDVAASAWSVAVPPGTTADAWIRAYCLVAESGDPCSALANQTVAATMDGHAGSLVSFAQDTQSFILVQNRIYVVAIWRSADYIPGGVPRLLEAYLSTMHLLPGVPAASASPRPS